MKRALILLIAVILFASCEKKSTNNTKVYFCVKNDSVYSNIPVFNNAHFKDSSGYYQNYTQAQIDFMIKSYTRMDTLFFRNDTLQLEFWSIVCNATE